MGVAKGDVLGVLRPPNPIPLKLLRIKRVRTTHALRIRLIELNNLHNIVHRIPPVKNSGYVHASKYAYFSSMTKYDDSYTFGTGTANIQPASSKHWLQLATPAMRATSCKYFRIQFQRCTAGQPTDHTHTASSHHHKVRTTMPASRVAE